MFYLIATIIGGGLVAAGFYAGYTVGTKDRLPSVSLDAPLKYTGSAYLDYEAGYVPAEGE